ncbi:MAG TPA: brain protein I3 [Firmicutes bacterium]|nr:brain protein I3 [Bacillota bacterium]
MYCPRCGSSRMHMLSETESTGKDYSAPKGVCGAILFGPLGLLCGLCGEERQIKTKHYWVCEDCGMKFRA